MQFGQCLSKTLVALVWPNAAGLRPNILRSKKTAEASENVEAEAPVGVHYSKYALRQQSWRS